MKPDADRRQVPPVWITGMGAITPLGRDVPSTWRGLLEGRDGMREINRFDLGGIACTRGGLVDLTEMPGGGEEPLMHDPAACFALQAGREALAQADDEGETADPVRTGLVVATNFGCSIALEPQLRPARAGNNGTAAGRPAPSACQGALADSLARRFNCRGPRGAVSLSCSAGAAAIAWAASMISHRRAGRMLVIGCDAISPFAWFGLCALRTMTRDRVRPFDANRSGTLFSEGAAAMVLEADDSMRQRRGRPLALLRGWDVNNNAHHMTAPAPRGNGTTRALRAAMAMAGVDPGEVGHYNAHGTGTKPNDQTEAEALRDTFGEAAGRIPVTAVKSSIGHMLGGAGTIEAIASVMALRQGLIPPTMNVTEPDPGCPLNLVRDRPLATALELVVTNSAGIGGNNAALVIAQP